MRMKHVLPLMLGVALAGCAPYALAVKETYEVATDPRSLADPGHGHGGRSADQGRAYSLAGEWHQRDRRLLPPGSRGARGRCATGSQAGQAAVQIARQTPGVKRVETYFVPSRPSWESDIAIKEQIRATHDRGPCPGVRPSRHCRLCRSCRTRRRGQLTGECSKVYCRRALGDWRRLRDVLHPDRLSNCAWKSRARNDWAVEHLIARMLFRNISGSCPRIAIMDKLADLTIMV